MLYYTLFVAVFCLSVITSTTATVTVYTATTTAAAVQSTYTAASTDQTVLTPPAAPQGQASSVAVQLYDGGMAGMGLPVSGGFLGFSIELSIANTILGENAQVLRPEFLNYCAVLESRGGAVTVRVGGNSQDKAILNINGNPSGKTIEKTAGTDASTTKTPNVQFTLDLFKAMAQITTLINVQWFFGIPFVSGDADGNAGLVLQNAQQILGSSLLGLQLANEPDLYAENQKKPANYSIPDFLSDTAQMIQRLPVTSPIIIGPSVCCVWTVDDVLNSGYLDQFASSLKYIDSMRYPDNNCAAVKPDPQTKFANYLSHTGVQSVISAYFNASNEAVAAGKQFMMMETNSASCGGFPGISDSFASSLWGVDWALQMAYGNFSFALMHFGGQNVYYNPFTPPPTNMTHLRKWSTGAIFYSNIVVAEALGKSGNSRVIDLMLDNNNNNRAGYAVYENGAASRVVLINYVSDPGNSDYSAVIGIGGGQTGLPATTPASVQVKYLLSATGVSEKFNITWAGQTMGGQFQSDGRLSGNAVVQTIACDTTAGTCTIPVPAPSVALVYLTDAAFQNSGGAAGNATGSTLTFATTVTSTKTRNTPVTFDMAAIATSNGRSGSDPQGATSKNAALNKSHGEKSAQVALTAVLLAASACIGWVAVQ